MDPSLNLQASEIPGALNVAIQHFNAGDLSQARDVFNRILKTDPREENALHLLGVVYFKEGDNEKAVELITEALDINNQFPAAHSNLGSVYKAQGRLEDAANCYRKAIDCQEDFTEAHFNLGNVLKDLHQLIEAEACYQKAIILNPDFADAHHNIGHLFFTHSKFDEAIESFRKAISIYPEFVEAHYMLGSTLKSLGRLEEAVENFRRALDLDPKHIKAQYAISVLTDNSIEAAPEEYLVSAFDNFASQFEHQMKIGNCRVPEILHSIAERLIDERRNFPVPPFARVLDLGCGTGLGGEAFKNISGKLHGVDLSEKMLEIAKDKKIYDALFQTNFEDFLRQTEISFDLILAMDVFVYSGPLENIFSLASARLVKGGMFAFSVERLDEGKYFLQLSTRFAHSEEYVHHLAREHRFEVVYSQSVEKMRNEVNGNLFWLEKTD